MAFRADEAERAGNESAMRYLVPRDLTGTDKIRSQDIIEDIILKFGPVIDAYPTWHPLVSAHSDGRNPRTTPRPENGYKGLDHTIFFANGFITCPYGKAEEVIESVEKLPSNPAATITAEKIDGVLYHPKATPVLVSCNWDEPLPFDGMVPKSIAVPLLLEQELPCWRWAQVAETWESMRPYFLGTPCGKRSSLFVNQETGQTIKKIWNELIYTGMFGPIKV